MSTLTSLSDALAALTATIGASLAAVRRHRHASTATAWDGDGHFVTTAATVKGRGAVELQLANGTAVTARVVGVDRGTDLAVLEADASVPVPRWDDGDDLVPGHLVLAMGAPRGVARPALGIVTRVSGPWRTETGALVDRFVDVDGALPPGFSGGPLVTADGRVLGVDTRRLIHGGTTVPTATVRRVAADLIAHGAVRTGYVGVGAQPVALPIPAEGHDGGLLLNWVDPDGPAARAGWFVGDVLLAVDNEPVRHPADLVRHMGGDAIGTTLDVRVLRAGTVISAPVEVGVRGRR